LREWRSRASSFSAGAKFDGLLNLLGILLAGLGGVIGNGSPKRVRSLEMLETGEGRDGVFPGAEARQGHAHGISTVVAIAQRKDLVVTGVETGHEDGEVVCFRSGVDEVDPVQRIRKSSREPFGILDDGGVKITGGGVLNEGCLFGESGIHFGMAVAHAYGADAPEAIEVAAARFVPEILHFALHRHEGVFVEEE
jgi:hypothetical protein